MNWRIGVSTGAWIGDDVAHAIDAIVRCGFRGIEVGTPPGHFDPWNVDQVRGLAERLQDTSVQPVSIHAPFGGLLDLSDPNPHHRHAAVGGILAAASALRDLGGRIVVVHATDVERVNEDVQRRLHDCATSLRVLLRSLEHMHMTLAVENPLPHLVGGHPDEFAWLLRESGEGARVCLDVSHATLGPDVARWLGLVAPRLVHVHANDHHGHFDDHLPPGSGVAPWLAIAGQLKHLEYEGWLILELNRDVSRSPEQLERARDGLLRVLGNAA